MKMISTLIAAFAAFSAFAQTDNRSIRVVVFGSELHFADQGPVMSNYRILVPLRGIFERLGATVKWEPSTQTVYAQRGQTQMSLAVGQRDATVNGRIVHLDVPATLVGGSTMVPLRFVTEALGADIKWNEADMEVDITRGTTDYDIPPVPVTPPLPIQPPRPTLPPERERFRVIRADTVLPFTLDNRITSWDAQVGDRFTATVTNERGYYNRLPSGTQLSGSVNYVRARRGEAPGLIELQFDQLIMPDGQRLTLDARLIDLKSTSVREDHGIYMAKTAEKYDRVMYSGYGSSNGVIVGLHGKQRIGDLRIDALLGQILDPRTRQRPATDVELAPGMKLGLRLREDLVLSRDGH